MKTWNLSDQESLQLAQKAGWSVASLARERGVCVRTLEREFQENHKTTVEAWLTGLRWKHAKQLLLEEHPVKIVGRRLGYKQENNFSREFKRRWGVSPSDFASQVSRQPPV